MPNKPGKYGLKYFNIVDVSTAYLLNTIPYLGKNTDDQNKTLDCVRKMFEKLSTRFFGSNQVIGMNNYFTSSPLAKNLFEKNLGMIGTIRNNKNEIPESFLASNSKDINSSLFAFNGPRTLVSFTPQGNHSEFLK